MLTATQSPFITRAPRDLSGWAACFDVAALPVLAETVDVLAELATNEDAVDAHMLAETLASDPLMTLKLLAHIARLRRGRDGGDIETVTEALVMLGIPPFFSAFGQQSAAEDLLVDHPEALSGFQAVLHRSRRASNFAIGFAVHRMDHDSTVIHEAALLHDFAELLLWLRAPTLAQEIAARQAADPALRSRQVQREVLNIELADLQHTLMQTWRLPDLLVRITADNHLGTAQARNVMLAIRVARHSALGWDNPALPDDVDAVADLLNLGVEPTWRLLRDIDGT